MQSTLRVNFPEGKSVYTFVPNKLILAIYALVVFGLVVSYDLYKGNTWLVLAATAIILIGGLLAWIASIRRSS